MREASQTTRQRIADRLRAEPMAAAGLARAFDIPASDAIDHVTHISQSLEPTDETLLVAPPECEDCGFTDFDDLINRPGRCPDCKSEAVTDPTFTID